MGTMTPAAIHSRPHPIDRRTSLARTAPRPDPVIRILAYFSFIRGCLGLAVATFLMSGGTPGILLAAIVGVPSLSTVVLAIGLVKMKAWARTLVVVFHLGSLALTAVALLRSGMEMDSLSLLEGLFSFTLVAWLAVRWDRFQ